MKIITEDPNTLVATDKAWGGLVASAIIGLGGVVVLALGAAKHSLVMAGGGAAALAIGAVAVLLRKQRTLVVDKAAKQVTVKMKTILKAQEFPYPIADITKIQLVTGYDTTTSGNGGSHTDQRTQLLLVLANGTTIDLADAQRSMQTFGIFGSTPNQAVAQRIAAYIGVPFETVGPPSLGQMVGMVKDMIGGATGQAPSVVPGAPASPVSPTPSPAPTAVPAQPVAEAQPAPAPAPAPIPLAAESPAPADNSTKSV